MYPVKRPQAAADVEPNAFVALWREDGEWVARVEFGLWDLERQAELPLGVAEFRAARPGEAVREARRRAGQAVRWIRRLLHELEAQVQDKPPRELSEPPDA